MHDNLNPIFCPQKDLGSWSSVGVRTSLRLKDDVSLAQIICSPEFNKMCRTESKDGSRVLSHFPREQCVFSVEEGIGPESERSQGQMYQESCLGITYTGLEVGVPERNKPFLPGG